MNTFSAFADLPQNWTRQLGSRCALLLAAGSMFISAGCNESPPEGPLPDPEPPVTIQLSIADVRATEVQLLIGIPDTVEHRLFFVEVDSQGGDTLSLLGSDTVVVYDSLFPGTFYTFRGIRTNGIVRLDSTDSLDVWTTDTTSRDFAWESIELGDHSSSGFLDLAIVNEDDIWAVGEVFMNDSMGQGDPVPFNAARWDGQKWELVRIQFPATCGQPGMAPFDIETVYAFDNSEVWFVTGTKIQRWDGTTFNLLCIPDSLVQGTARKLWGESTNSVYVVGDGGTLVHWNGSSWNKITSGTDLHIQDIWGGWNETLQEYEIILVASNKFQNEGMQLMKIIPQGTTPLSVDGLSWSLSSVWFTPDETYHIAGDGIYHSRSLPSVWERDESFPSFYKDAVRGLGVADIVVSGSNGLLSHFNGISWKHYQGSELPFIEGRYQRVDIVGNTVVAVGYSGSRGIIVKGVR